MDRSRPARSDRQDRGRDRPAAPPPPLPEVNVTFVPDDAGVDSLARQIRVTGRAYPLFEIARLVLQKPERHEVTLSTKKNADGAVVQALFLCALDDTLWLSEEAAVQHVLERHFATFYQPERTKIDPPKGTYTFVAQCGLSGAILGPPNYHDYQNQLRKLHSEKFSRMPFEAFKARVRIVKDEATVNKWFEEQSWKTEFVCLNVPEPLKLGTRPEVEAHFRQVHLSNIIKSVESHRMNGAASRNLRDRELLRLVRHRWEEQRRFPLQVATVLSQQFATRGLQFFKVNKTVTHVAVARPHYLDLETTPVSEGVRRIVEFISAHPKCTHRQLLQSLAPGPPAPGSPTGETAAGPGSVVAEPSPELAAVMTDLHWLIHQGHVIEFANGILETAKKPAPKPTKPAAPAETPAASEAPNQANQSDAAHEVNAAHADLPPPGEPPAEVLVRAPEPTPVSQTPGDAPPSNAPSGA